MPGQMGPMGPMGPGQMGPGQMGPMGPGQMMPMGPMGPGQPPVRRSSGALPWVIGGIATVVVLCLVGIGVVFAALDDDDPGPRPTDTTTTSGPSEEPSQAPSGSAASGKSNFTSLGDICPKVDTAVLGDWATTREAANTSQNKTTYSEWSSCYLRVRSAAKEMSTLDVTAKVYGSPEDAKDTLDSARKYGASKTFDADIPGLGEEAFGKYEEQQLSGRLVTYEVETRSGNLALSVRLTKFNTPSTTKDQIKAKAIAQAKSALAALSK
jgi:hypothetical protein